MSLVLVVDDSKFARLLVRAAVEKVLPAAVIHEAAAADEALKLVDASDAYRFCTIDHNMPGMKGLVLAEILRGRLPSARIALVTANIQDTMHRRAAELGIAFIGKPITEEKMRAFLAGGHPSS